MTKTNGNSSGRRIVRTLPPGLVAFALLAGLLPVAGAQDSTPLQNVARILGEFDIDGDGTADNFRLPGSEVDPNPDTDGDGLPDSWELGGFDIKNTDVPFPAPAAIVPGTPPASIFARRAVRTNAAARDTDGDGLSDFIEVFGLKFIDDWPVGDPNGQLDDACDRVGGQLILDEFGRPRRRMDSDGNPMGDWYDLNGDGMPSIGEYPATNILIEGSSSNFDFDGFIFTDPTNADTDGDGIRDGVDVDPLINPSAFGIGGSGQAQGDLDRDNDGLGDLMDMGDDALNSGELSNPSDLRRVIELFRPDLFRTFGRQSVRVPEGLIEDILAADWNGDGLFQLTDLRTPHFGLTAPPSETAGIELFERDDKTALGFFETPFPAGFVRETYYRFANRGPTGVDVPLPYQEVLLPTSRDENEFLPDPRIWTVLYSWRMPGFDIDGNGFIGFDGASLREDTVEVNVNPDINPNVKRGAAGAPSTDVSVAGVAGIENLDGRIESQLLDGCGQGACGGISLSLLALTLSGIFLMRPRRR